MRTHIYICQPVGQDPFIAIGKGSVLNALTDDNGGHLDNCAQHSNGDLTILWINDIDQQIEVLCLIQPHVYGDTATFFKQPG